jgi:two-component system, chemotaxis family, chemotaxis protein CheY
MISSNRRTALIAEDELISVELLSAYLKTYNFRSVCVANGEEAVLSFSQALKEGNPFGLICMDIEMPKLDGFSALRKIRELEKNYYPSRSERSVVLIVSAKNTPENMVRAFSGYGCNGFLPKPIDPQYFKQLLCRNRLVI